MLLFRPLLHPFGRALERGCGRSVLRLLEKQGKSRQREIARFLSVCFDPQSGVGYAEEKAGISQEPIELFSVYIAAEGDTPEDVILHEELESLVEKAFARLPERCRMIYYLVREEGKSYRETAEMLGISERTVNSQMTIAKRKLTDLLCDYFSSKRSPLKK